MANAERMPTAAFEIGITILTDVFVPILRGKLLLAMDTESLLVGHLEHPLKGAGFAVARILKDGCVIAAPAQFATTGEGFHLVVGHRCQLLSICC